MFAQAHFPAAIAPADLDDYLAKGWFRMGQSIFTTNFLNFNQHFYSAIWLRVGLAGFAPDKEQRRLAKVNELFQVEIQKASLTPQKENLFNLYRKTVSFEASPTLYHLLYGKASTDIYDTWEVCVYDGPKLIACGFFDLGRKSAAGITSFYDPGYRRHSLGKYVIFLKIKNCFERGLAYFYPGYFVPGYEPFNYKLKINRERLQYLDLYQNVWQPVGAFNEALSPLAMMKARLLELQLVLLDHGIAAQVLCYEFYDAALVPELSPIELFDFPLFLHYHDWTGDRVNTLVVFDVRDRRYHLLAMGSVWSSRLETHEDHYSAHLLQAEHDLFSCATAEEMAAAIQGRAQQLKIMGYS